MTRRSPSPIPLLTACLALAFAPAAHAGGPRFISGTSGFSTPGVPMAFYTNQPLYYTDPGDLSPTVTSAQADAMVAAAAAVWNVPQASLVLAQGGKLAEHVSSANAYFNGTSIIFPADVQPTNYRSIPIAVLYDTDGSITDLLLGQGASTPTAAGCRQNGVIESVDAFGYVPAIDHAVIVLNGRCIDSPADRPYQLLQMQYQLMRIFGRVLGLAWSQLNDNVFTGDPVPSTFQMDNWPVMHPIDILCGPYTYQCMVNPFTLRTDDIAALAQLYPNPSNTTLPAGKQPTAFDAVSLFGPVTFPTGQQAELVNVTVIRGMATESSWESAPIVSTVSGFQFQQNGGSPVSGPEAASLNAGSNNASVEGQYSITYFPIGPVFSNVKIQTESINPLYIGDYAVGPYQRPVITQPGSQQTGYAWTLGNGQIPVQVPLNLTDAPNSCNPGNDGTEAAPAAADPSGWWSGLICSAGHASWFSTTVRANHTWTLEATALNATGQATINALQPVLGVWNSTDPTGTLPTVAAAPTAMNSLALGMTQLHVPAAAADATLRLTVADQYGAGRPDFPYTGRILYADSVAPATVPLTGGQITITGMGFRKGNTVQINGVPATVLSWSATQITAITPTQAAAGATTGTAVDVLVTDPSTAGTTSIPAAVTYADITPTDLVTITTPTAWLAAGAAGQWTISLDATLSGAPAASTAVAWSSASTLTLNPASSTTNAAGLATTTAQTAAIPANSTSTVTGCAWGSVCATWTVYGVDPSLWQIAITSGAAQTIASGQTLSPINLLVTDNAGHPLPGATVNLYQTAYAWQGPCTTTRCPAAPVLAASHSSAVSDGNGMVALPPLQLANTAQTVAIAASTGTDGFTTTTLTVHP
jgi:hypothetical protein